MVFEIPSKVSFPNRVRFVTDRYEYDSAYWLAIDELTPGTLCKCRRKIYGSE